MTDDQATARAEIDECMLNIDQAVRRIERAVLALDGAEGVGAEAAALSVARDRLVLARRGVVEAIMATSQQRLI